MQQQSYKRMRRVLVFGEAGTGKTSMLNALASGKTGERHETSDSMIGCTFKNQKYRAIFLSNDGDNRVQYLFVDTVGLNEGKGGQKKSFTAMMELSKFLAENRRGFHL